MKLEKKHKTYIGIGAGVLLLVVLIIILVKALRKPAQPQVDTSKTGGATGFNVGESAPVKDDKFPLHVGSYGPNVAALQSALNRINEQQYNHKIDTLTVDKDFGDKTYTAVLLLAGTRYLTDGGVSQDSFTQILHTANSL
jgi:peptidoglycan hydrolase-like protein with peptidoglycan-binding domain